MPWRPESPDERPTLGPIVLDWMIDNLATPDRVDYQPFYPTVEQAEFLMKFYELDPHTGRRIIQRGVLSRSRGWGKSPFLSAMALAEALGDVVPDGWDADGRPVGKPWATVCQPLVVVAAASEDQTQNSWLAMLDMLHEDAPVFANYPGMEPMGSRVNLPFGHIKPVTSSPASSKGFRPTFVIADQTEQWLPSVGGKAFMRILRSNAVKVGGSLVEAPNAYIPGQDSVAENTARAFFAMREGRTKTDRGLLYDHREAPASTVISDRESLEYGMRWAYGCSSGHPDGCLLHEHCEPGWVDIDNRINDAWMEDSDEQDVRLDWLNQITFASDSWLGQVEWTARRDASKVVQPGDVVTLGFDGSRGRVKGKPDATALVGCRVSDGHLFVLDVWEAPDMKESWADWEPPIPEIEERIARAFKEYKIVGMYCDPARDWRSYVNKWEAAHPVPVKASSRHPMEWWMFGGRVSLVEDAIELMESAVHMGDLTHSGDDRLTRHVLNARRRLSHGKLTIDKESRASINKIDAAIAAVLAFRCRADAVSAGFGQKKTRAKVRAVRKGIW